MKRSAFIGAAVGLACAAGFAGCGDTKTGTAGGGSGDSGKPIKIGFAMGFTGATIRPGVEIVAELVGLATALEDADLVITGEGRADEQTLQGKTAMGVATLARPRSTPVVLLCGALGSGADAVEASGAFSLVQPIGDRPATLEAAMEDSARLLANAAARVARGIGIGLEIGPSA